MEVVVKRKLVITVAIFPNHEQKRPPININGLVGVYWVSRHYAPK
jgi:hypothetical protein